MFRKLKLKTLSIVFVILLVLVVITKVVDNSHGTNTLKASIYSVNADDITSVILKPKAADGKEVKLIKSGNNWSVESNGNTYNGDPRVIENLIKSVNNLKPLRLAAQNKDQWNKYELTDSLSSMVSLMNGNKELARLYIGKFSYKQAKQQMPAQQNPYYQQPRGTMMTYVRSNDDDDVYAVQGFLGNLVNQKAESFRNKEILKINKTEINKITFSYPADSSFTLVKNADKWMCDGLPVDSASMVKYLRSISNVRGSSFTSQKPSNFVYKVNIDGGKSPVEVKASLNDEDAIIASSQNEGTLIKDTKKTHFKKIFISKNSLFKK